MRRREFIAGLGGTVAWPVGARSQKSALPIIGVLHSSTFTEARRSAMFALHHGLTETGYVEGRDVTLDYRWAEDRYERLPELAADLVRRQVAVIATLMNTPAALAAKAATHTIPIVFFLGVDPVEYGLVASWARPGGNVTGFTGFGTKLIAKRMQLLRELVPAATTIAYLFNPANFSNEIEGLQIAARILGIRVLMMEVSAEGNFDLAIEKMAQQQAGALLVSAESRFLQPLWKNRHLGS